MGSVSFRYIVDDVEAAVAFYRDALGFEVRVERPPGFAVLALDGATLYVNATGGPGGASQAMPDGRVPEPGGWNRIQIAVADLDSEIERLRGAGVSFRNEVVEGRGGRQVLVEDPSGNPVELFEPAPG